MKINWLIKGDKPTEFVFSKINILEPKRRSNLIFNDNGSWSSPSEKIAHEAINYFSELFLSSQATFQFPDITCKKIQSDNARNNLCKPFQLKEIKESIFQTNDNSSPGLDGLNSKFYKVHWRKLNMISGML